MQKIKPQKAYNIFTDVIFPFEIPVKEKWAVSISFCVFFIPFLISNHVMLIQTVLNYIMDINYYAQNILCLKQ